MRAMYIVINAKSKSIYNLAFAVRAELVIPYRLSEMIFCMTNR